MESYRDVQIFSQSGAVSLDSPDAASYTESSDNSQPADGTTYIEASTMSDQHITFPSVLERISKLDPVHDLERLLDTCYCVGLRLHEWLYPFDKVAKIVFSRALAAGFEPSGLLTPIKKAMLNGFNEYRDK